MNRLPLSFEIGDNPAELHISVHDPMGEHVGFEAKSNFNLADRSELEARSQQHNNRLRAVGDVLKPLVTNENVCSEMLILLNATTVIANNLRKLNLEDHVNWSIVARDISNIHPGWSSTYATKMRTAGSADRLFAKYSISTETQRRLYVDTLSDQQSHPEWLIRNTRRKLNWLEVSGLVQLDPDQTVLVNSRFFNHPNGQEKMTDFYGDPNAVVKKRPWQVA